MTPEQIEIVRGTVADLDGRITDVAEILYRRLFERHPELRDRFPPDPTEQAAKFAAELDAIVALLPELGRLTPEAAALGRRHEGYGVRAADYPLVRDALLDALAEVLGGGFADVHRLAWRRAYDLVAEVMQDAGRQA